MHKPFGPRDQVMLLERFKVVLDQALLRTEPLLFVPSFTRPRTVLLQPDQTGSSSDPPSPGRKGRNNTPLEEALKRAQLDNVCSAYKTHSGLFVVVVLFFPGKLHNHPGIKHIYLKA